MHKCSIHVCVVYDTIKYALRLNVCCFKDTSSNHVPRCKQNLYEVIAVDHLCTLSILLVFLKSSYRISQNKPVSPREEEPDMSSNNKEHLLALYSLALSAL